MKSFRYFRPLCLLLIFINSFASIFLIKGSGVPPAIYIKDFSNSYLLGAAILHGLPPYQPLSDIATQLQEPDFARNTFSHPTPRTVADGLLVAPTTLFPYRIAYLIWCLFSLCCLTGASVLLLRWWRGAPPAFTTTALFVYAAVGWWPLTYDLFQGQINTLLLTLFVLAWLAFRQGKDALSGAVLGTAISLKMLGWPLVLLLLWQRRWRGVLAALAVFFSVNVVSIAAVGWQEILNYYLKVGPELAQYYNRFYFNLSLWSVGTRLFSGLGKTVPGAKDLVAAPLWAAPQLVRGVSLAVVLVVLASGLWLAYRARQADTQFSLLLCLSILVNPVAWQCYLVPALIPIFVVFRRLKERGFPPALTAQAIGLALLLSIPNWLLRFLSEQFVVGQAADGRDIVAFWAGCLNFLPALVLLGWCWLVWRSDEVNLTASVEAEERLWQADAVTA